jgi:aryl-phospho-beta-D-glucosidase BglC (GH1 family)
MIDGEFAQEFAREWIEAWNAHDLERIFSHYRDDFEMSSPLIIERMNEPSGVLKGKAAIRPYWQRGLAAQPPLHFELDFVTCGVASITLVYRNQSGVRATEVLFFAPLPTTGEPLQVVRGVAHYAR